MFYVETCLLDNGVIYLRVSDTDMSGATDEAEGSEEEEPSLDDSREESFRPDGRRDSGLSNIEDGRAAAERVRRRRGQEGNAGNSKQLVK